MLSPLFIPQRPKHLHRNPPKLPPAIEASRLCSAQMEPETAVASPLTVPTNSNTITTAGSGSDEVDLDHSPFLLVFKDGRVKRLLGTAITPPTLLDPATGVSSRDVAIQPGSGVSARLYLPKDTPAGSKLPVLVYYHGGAFCIESAFSPTYNNYLNYLVSECHVLAVSVDYRLAPEHPLPAAYDDSWEALQWVASHSGSTGPDPWLNDHADLGHLFLAGDSAGANICHSMAMRAGVEQLAYKVEIEGLVLVHPYFYGKEPIGSESTDPALRKRILALWLFICPLSTGLDDHRIDPFAEGAPNLSGLACRRVLMCAGEKDIFRDRTWRYYQRLKESGWGGEVEIMESKGQEHVFHLEDLRGEKAVEMMGWLASFFNDGA